MSKSAHPLVAFQRAKPALRQHTARRVPTFGEFTHTKRRDSACRVGGIIGLRWMGHGERFDGVYTRHAVSVQFGDWGYLPNNAHISTGRRMGC